MNVEQKTLTIGTRGSALALAQSALVRAMLRRAHPFLEIEIRTIKTSGDIMPAASLARSGTKGLFIRELEQALLRKKIDVAVHSLKDLPTDLPAGLVLSAVPEREDARDVLIALSSDTLQAPKIVLTSSPRRAFQSKLLWPGCETREIRGNIETRLRKLEEVGLGHALLLAVAGLRRLDFLKGYQDEGQFDLSQSAIPKEILFYRKLPIAEMLPAPGQAALGLETRADDGITQERLRCVNHFGSWSAVTAERSFLQSLGGGCAAPVAAYANVTLPPLRDLRLHGLVFDGKGNLWRGEKTGKQRESETLGKALAKEFIEAKGSSFVTTQVHGSAVRASASP